ISATMLCTALLLAQPVLAKDAGDQRNDPAAQMVATGAGDTGTSEGKSEPEGAASSGSEGEAAAAEPVVWSEEEIAQAKAHCEKVLRGVEAIIEPAEPIKEGECGAPAPVRLIGIGRDPEITMSPPVTVSCDLVATLADWIKDDL